VTLVCFASAKGSPGVTTTALAVAASWVRAGRRRLLLEADADGGSVALRYQMPTKPGLISLAAAARKELDRNELWDHAQLLPGGLAAVLAPEGPEQAAMALRSISRELGPWLRDLPDVDVVADLGRLSVASPALELARSADALLLVARPVANQLQPAAQRLAAIARLGPKVGWVMIGDRPYAPSEVEAAYGFPVVTVLPADRRTAGALETGANPNRIRRTTLVRSIADLAGSLVGWLDSETPDDVAAVSPQLAVQRSTPPLPAGDPDPSRRAAGALPAPPPVRRRPQPPLPPEPVHDPAGAGLQPLPEGLG
jgi:MinD-like ATPase involved in chromosome partitioning or flagellar assembly